LKFPKKIVGIGEWRDGEKTLENVRKNGEDFGRRAEAWGEDFGRRADKELSKIGVIFGLLIGVIMVLVGIAWIAGIELTQYFWALIIIVFGLLVLAGSIYGLKQRP
jgi:tetrahydromethanopterin S-methyltransferase subunit G